MEIRFDGKVAAVTGGGSGMGREIARLFAESGARVVVADLNEDHHKETVQIIEDAGGEALSVTCDVTDEDQVREFVDFAVSSYGQLNCAVNAAGISFEGTIEDLPTEKWDAIIKVNLYGLYYAMKYEIPAMRQSGGGAIVNITSNNALVVTAAGSAYGASKWAALGLTKSVALELAGQGIRVNAVGPGATDTPMIARLRETAPEVIDAINAAIPDGRMGVASEPAYAALFLCSDYAAHITAEQITVDGGQNAEM